jgi:hypothetical protein
MVTMSLAAVIAPMFVPDLMALTFAPLNSLMLVVSATSPTAVRLFCFVPSVVVRSAPLREMELKEGLLTVPMVRALPLRANAGVAADAQGF